MRKAPSNDYIDITRTSWGNERLYNCSNENIKRRGVFMALDSPQIKGGSSVHVCTGEPGELFAGVFLHFTPAEFVSLGCGNLWLFTLHYDVECLWRARNDCLVVLGPEGNIKVGKFPDDINVAIGRVFSEPSATDPYLGVRVVSWG